MKRTVILLLDSFGIGGAEDADQFMGETAEGETFNDKGSNTLAHIAQACYEGRAEEGRSGPLKIPNLNRLGIGRACKETCSRAGVLLKVIIESGELKEEALIRRASEICIDAGADFIKTSTGKVAVNATPEAARIMLEVIREKDPKVGFKAAGGVRDAKTAKAYMDLAGEILGDDWVTPSHFRFGASGLLGALLSELGLAEDDQKKGGY